MLSKQNRPFDTYLMHFCLTLFIDHINDNAAMIKSKDFLNN